MNILVQAKLFHSTQVPKFRSATATATISKTEPNRTAVQPRLTPSSSDPSLRSTWSHRACVASGSTAVLVSLAKAVAAASDHSGAWLGPALAGLAGHMAADLGTGIYHWGIDNYGDTSTLIIGSQIEKAQGHHKWPGTITRREVANNLHAAALGVAIAVGLVDILSDNGTLHGFVGVFGFCVMLSQQFHAWAHLAGEEGEKAVPPLVAVLQELGVLLSASQHAEHHGRTNDKGYCIVSGLWNGLLDEQMVVKKLEILLFIKFGVRPKSWAKELN